VTSSWFLIHNELWCTVNHTSDLQIYCIVDLLAVFAISVSMVKQMPSDPRQYSYCTAARLVFSMIHLICSISTGQHLMHGSWMCTTSMANAMGRHFTLKMNTLYSEKCQQYTRLIYGTTTKMQSTIITEYVTFSVRIVNVSICLSIYMKGSG